MAFIRTRTINGHTYSYLEERYRSGGKVRSKSTYLGRILVALAPIAPEDRGLKYIARMMEKYPSPAVAPAPAAPVPIEKAPPEINYAAANPAEQSPGQSSDTSSSPDADE